MAWQTGFAVVLAALAFPPEAMPPTEADVLARSLREILLALLPNPLYEDAKHWGLQSEFERLHWRGKGFNIRPEMVTEMRNDGRWWKTRIYGNDLPRTLSVVVRDLKRPTTERMEFELLLSLETYIETHRQTWWAGTRLYSGSVRARARAGARLRCEATVRFESPKGAIVPDVVLQFRLVSGEFAYDNVKVEHLPGFGGEAAELLGEVIFETARLVKPALEEKLFDKARQAIAKAGQMKEVRLSLSKWLGK